MSISDTPAEFAPVSRPGNWPEGLIIRAERPDDVDGLTVLQGLPKFRAGTLRLPYPRRKDIEAIGDWAHTFSDLTLPKGS